MVCFRGQVGSHPRGAGFVEQVTLLSVSPSSLSSSVERKIQEKPVLGYSEGLTNLKVLCCLWSSSLTLNPRFSEPLSPDQRQELVTQDR